LHVQKDEPLGKIVIALNNVNLKIVTEKPEEIFENRIKADLISKIKGLSTFNKFRKYIASILVDVFELNQESSFRENRAFNKSLFKSLIY